MSSSVSYYHAFPRRWQGKKDLHTKGLEILCSIAKRGLLVTPECVEWPGEIKLGQKIADGTISYTKRACLTQLSPREVLAHSETFGPFAIEFDSLNVRVLGAIPVFYIPVSQEFTGFLGLGLGLASRMADFQDLLLRLKTFLEVAETWSDLKAPLYAQTQPDGDLLVGPCSGQALRFPKALFEKIRRDNPYFDTDKKLTTPVPVGGSVGCMVNFLKMLTWGIQSFDIQLGAIKGLSGFFYPTERIGSNDTLSYYRQREWRILAGLTKNSSNTSRKLTAPEKAELLSIDAGFFSKSIFLPATGLNARIVDECEYLSEVDGKPLLSYAKRVICPKAVVRKTRAILNSAGLENLPIADAEALADTP